MRCIIIFSSNNLVKTLAVYAFSQKEILPMQVLQINKQEFKLWKYGVYVSYLTNLILQKKQWERQISYDTAYMWKLKKKNTNEFIYKTETGSQTYRTNLWLLGRREGDRLGVWDGHVNTAIVKLDNQQGPTAQHRECYAIFCNNLK